MVVLIMTAAVGLWGGLLVQEIMSTSPGSLGAIAQLLALGAIAPALAVLGEWLVGSLAKGFSL